MKQDYRELLQPENINSISGLALIAKLITEAYLAGLHHSSRLGPGMEFSQYRAYEPGDDLRLLDWKMLARSGRYYVRQSEVETNVAVKFILDSSNSMLHQQNGISKMDYARILVASLAYLAQSQGDAVGLFALNDKNLHALYPRVQKKHFNRLLQELLEIKNEGKWPINVMAAEKLHDRRHKELIFFISDLYEENSEIRDIIKKLKTPKNEVVVLQIMTRDELEFNYSGNLYFEDLETGKKVKLDAKPAKQNYLDALNNSLENIKQDFLSTGISYHLFQTDEAPGEALQILLKQRNNLL